jgi:hypothetical protein
LFTLVVTQFSGSVGFSRGGCRFHPWGRYWRRRRKVQTKGRGLSGLGKRRTKTTLLRCLSLWRYRCNWLDNEVAYSLFLGVRLRAQLEGKVTESLPNAMFRVELQPTSTVVRAAGVLPSCCCLLRLASSHRNAHRYLPPFRARFGRTKSGLSSATSLRCALLLP